MVKNPILILFIVAGVCFSTAYGDNCLGAAMAALSSPAAANMILSTGKQLNDLGDYDLCRTTEGMKYGAISVVPMGATAKFFIGMCLPEQ